MIYPGSKTLKCGKCRLAEAAVTMAFNQQLLSSSISIFHFDEPRTVPTVSLPPSQYLDYRQTQNAGSETDTDEGRWSNTSSSSLSSFGFVIPSNSTAPRGNIEDQTSESTTSSSAPPMQMAGVKRALEDIEEQRPFGKRVKIEEVEQRSMTNTPPHTPTASKPTRDARTSDPCRLSGYKRIKEETEEDEPEKKRIKLEPENRTTAAAATRNVESPALIFSNVAHVPAVKREENGLASKGKSPNRRLVLDADLGSLSP